MEDMRATLDRVILGIDPGTTVMGYAVIRIVKRSPELVVMGGIDLRKIKDTYLKLKRISERIQELVEEYLPDEMALEAPFFGKNVQSMLKLGRAQGVAMAAALVRDIPVTEYAPRKVKMMVVGQGEASKEQVSLMLKAQFKIAEMPKTLDASDALAVAVCHYYSTLSESRKQLQNKPVRPTKKKAASSWAQFVREHPEKLV